MIEWNTILEILFINKTGFQKRTLIGTTYLVLGWFWITLCLKMGSYLSFKELHNVETYSNEKSWTDVLQQPFSNGVSIVDRLIVVQWVMNSHVSLPSNGYSHENWCWKNTKDNGKFISNISRHLKRYLLFFYISRFYLISLFDSLGTKSAETLQCACL